MDHTQAEETIDLREYLNILRFRKWTFLIVATLVVGSAIGLSLLQTPIYSAKAKVLVKPVSFPSATTSSVVPINLETESQIAASEPVANLVVEDLGLDRSLESLLSDLSVRGIIETEVLEITYTSPFPQFAQDVANSFADNYLTFRREEALKTITSSQDAIQRRLDAASSQLTGITEDLEAAREAADEALVATLETSRNIFIARLGVLQQRLDDLQANQSADISGGQLLEVAALPTSPSSPNYLTNTALGLFLGSTLGVGAAFLKERLDNRFRGRADVERVLESPVLATIPRFRAGKKERVPDLVASWQPSGFASEAYRTLRTNLQFIADQNSIKSVLVTSPTAAEGKTVTVANLAVVLAQVGSRVIVVSADLRRPTLQRLFPDMSHHDKGLSSWMASADREPVWDFLQDPGIPNIRILPSGPRPPNPAELLASPRVAELIEALESQSDIVLFDSAPVLAVADSTLLATKVGGTILVVNALSTHRSPARQAKEELERVGGNLIGSVLNAYDPTASSYYYGPYYYRYDAGKDDGNAHEERSRRRGLRKSASSSPR